VSFFKTSQDFLSKTGDVLIVNIISVVDMFLLGVLILMIAISLYELYIAHIPGKYNMPQALLIDSLDELKTKIGKLVFMILLVAFFKQVIKYDFTSMAEMLMLAISIFFISLSLYFVADKKTTTDMMKKIRK
jgi:uncharacterized membrane protein YqhA